MGEQPRKILIRKEIISMKNHSVKAAEFSALLLGAVLITGAFASGCSGNDTASGIPDVQVQDQDSDQNQEQNQDQEESGDGEELKNGTASELGSLKTFSAGTLAGETFTEEDIQEKDVTVINFCCAARASLKCRISRLLPERFRTMYRLLRSVWTERRPKRKLDSSWKRPVLRASPC